MNKITELLKGKKTYLSACIGLLYLLGAWMKWWECDPKFLAAIGMSSLMFLRAAVDKGPSVMALVGMMGVMGVMCLAGCVSATASRTAKDGSTDSIKVSSFLSTITNGKYGVTNSDGTSMALTTDASTPDQQSIAILAGAVTELGKGAMALAAKPVTNAAAVVVVTNAP